MTEVSARFYVIATTGWNAAGTSHNTGYAVLDRLWAHREVYSQPTEERGRGQAAAFRRMACERVAEALNARHEQHMREIGEAWIA